MNAFAMVMFLLGFLVLSAFIGLVVAYALKAFDTWEPKPGERGHHLNNVRRVK